VVRKIFEFKKNEVSEQFIIIYSEELSDLYRSSSAYCSVEAETLQHQEQTGCFIGGQSLSC
jgi:hypothetical protein